MPDQRFASMQRELKDTMYAFGVYMCDKQGFQDKPLEQLMRGVQRFPTFLAVRSILKGDQVQREWRA